jgi:sodium/hydrogen antiporter
VPTIVGGLTGAVTLGWSWRRNWTEPSALRLGVLALPVMAYTLAIPLGGNGFVSAFAAGVLLSQIIPVVLALRGTTITRLEAIFIGWMGPRGLASLVFGLLAVIALNGSPSSLTAQVMIITVLLSVILHGVTAGPIAAAFARRAAAGRREEKGEPAAAISRVPRGIEPASTLHHLRAAVGREDQRGDTNYLGVPEATGRS